jgi:hypothetical protein
MNPLLAPVASSPGHRTPLRSFTQQFSSTRRGARLARLLATAQFDAWGWPYGSETSRTAALLVAELSANAVFHGRLPGRDFRLRLALGRVDGPPAQADAPSDAPTTLLRIEVTDPRGECPPLRPAGSTPAPGNVADGGRGLLLVETLATRWGWQPYLPSGKTVWCELEPGPGLARER